MLSVHEGEFVRARIPGYLEPSLQLALGDVHAPFFMMPQGSAVTLVLRREEWDRLAPRFASAQAEPGFRLVSVQPAETDPSFPPRLTAALGDQGLTAQLLPSFHSDHLLVAMGELDRTLAAVRRVLHEDSTGETEPAGSGPTPR